MKDKPIIKEVFADNGDVSHYVLIDIKTGDKLWSELPEECKAMGFPVKSLPNEKVIVHSDKFIKGLAEKYAEECDFKSDFPHDFKSVEDGYIKGFSDAKELSTKDIDPTTHNDEDIKLNKSYSTLVSINAYLDVIGHNTDEIKENIKQSLSQLPPSKSIEREEPKEVYALIQWLNDKPCIDGAFYSDNPNPLIEHFQGLPKVDGVDHTIVTLKPFNKPNDVEPRAECEHGFKRVERDGEFQGNQCLCGEWENMC